MNNKDTEQLQHELSSADTVEEYLTANQDHLRQCTLAEYLSQLLEEKHLSRKEVIEKSELDSIYAYHIFAGRKGKPSRTKVISIALAMGLTPKETQHLLYYAGAEQLYVRNSWDSVIWHALDNHLSVRQTNKLLESLSETEFL
ncbi:MAG: helix-turn-helix domain-containing protein [Selenomonadaceae bacterium]|nr:helix-turn-helix domain-containing protein [Selenomonadaceae bacterium]